MYSIGFVIGMSSVLGENPTGFFSFIVAHRFLAILVMVTLFFGKEKFNDK